MANDTPLPVACFNNARPEFDIGTCQMIVDQVIKSGRAWISTIQLGQTKRPAIRACITNFRTDGQDLDQLVNALEEARACHR